MARQELAGPVNWLEHRDAWNYWLGFGVASSAYLLLRILNGEGVYLLQVIALVAVFAWAYHHKHEAEA
jgi:hypothetical protein